MKILNYQFLLRLKTYFMRACFLVGFNFTLGFILSPKDLGITDVIGDDPPLMIISILILLVVFEESLMRWLPYKIFKRSNTIISNPSYMIFLFALIGALYHMQNIPRAPPISAAKYFLIQGIGGAFLGYYYLQYKFEGSYFIHLMYNMILYLPHITSYSI